MSAALSAAPSFTALARQTRALTSRRPHSANATAVPRPVVPVFRVSAAGADAATTTTATTPTRNWSKCPEPAVVAPGSELEALLHVSNLVYDTKRCVNEYGELGKQAATVSAAILLATLMSNTKDVGALEGAMVYEPCTLEECAMDEDARLECVIDKAFVNLGAMMAERVEGLVSVEVDVHAAHDPEQIVARARRMRDMFDELGVSRDKILFKIPGTWQGVQAVEALEKEGIHCHVTLVYCLEQAAAAARAGATLIQVYVGRVRTWYKSRHEQAVKNHLGDAADPGVEFVRQTCAFIKSNGLKSKVIAASVRGRSDVLALAGVDYILLNDRIIAELNDKVSSVSGASGPLEDQMASATCPDHMTEDLAWIDQGAFETALRNSAAMEYLENGITGYVSAEEQLKEFIKQKMPPPNV